MALTQFKYPLSLLQQNRISVSQSQTVLSYKADATSWPSGEKAIALTKSKCPASLLSEDPIPGL